ncbi:putative 3-isopropylmalate dehydratase [Helianthus annuus]|nr:putative 3-isopropylmalate dehydratase [Helianthus annuus]KAJ0934177.1 putative 3-isopropylmalate dehydratase [Helianthus annuus]
MEFVGTTNESLSMVERMKLCNMVVEVRGKNGIVPTDATTYKYLEWRKPSCCDCFTDCSGNSKWLN